MTEEQELLRKFAEEGAQDAFAEVVRRRIDFVYTAALRQLAGDAHMAADVTQSVFLALAKAVPELVQRESIAGWLYTTTRNLAVRAIRKQQRWKHREQEAIAMSETNNEPSHDDVWLKLAPVLDETLDKLSTRDREVIVMRYLDGRSFADVGRVCELSENAARMRTERALEKLRGLLARRGVTSTAAALGLAMANQALTAAPAGLAASVTSATLTTAAVATAGAGGMTLIQFMSIAKMKAGIIGAVVVASAATVGSATLVNSALEQDRERARLEALDAESLQRQKRVAELEAKIAATEAARIAAERKAAELKAAQVPEPKPKTPSMDKVNSVMAAFTLNPDNKPYQMEKWKLKTLRDYAPLCEELGLSREVRNQFIEKVTNMLYTGMLDQAENRPMDGAAIKATYAELRQLLGDEGYKKYREMTGLTVPLKQMENISWDLADAGIPITATQQLSSARALAQTRREWMGINEGTSSRDPRLMSLLTEALAKQDPTLTEAQRYRIADALIEDRRQSRIVEALARTYESQTGRGASDVYPKLKMN